MEQHLPNRASPRHLSESFRAPGMMRCRSRSLSACGGCAGPAGLKLRCNSIQCAMHGAQCDQVPSLPPRLSPPFLKVAHNPARHVSISQLRQRSPHAAVQLVAYRPTKPAADQLACSGTLTAVLHRCRGVGAPAIVHAAAPAMSVAMASRGMLPMAAPLHNSRLTAPGEDGFCTPVPLDRSGHVAGVARETAAL